LNNIWMSYDLYNLNFSHYACNVCLLFYLVFFKYFYRYFFLGVHMGTQSDFSEGALSNSFAWHSVKQSKSTYPHSSFQFSFRLVIDLPVLVDFPWRRSSCQTIVKSVFASSLFIQIEISN
jgi:hypothetical protein